MAKFLFDFDGVLTEQSEEADRVLEIFTARLSECAGISTIGATAVIESASAALAEEPWRHGWMSQGRVSAFANEDLFIRNNGIAAELDACADAGDRALSAARERLAKHGGTNFVDLCRDSYDMMAAETRAGSRHPVDEAVAPLLRSLLDEGHSIVVVSNSGTSRIIALLSEVGLSPEEHAGRFDRPLRVRGGARKYDLDETIDCFQVGSYGVETRRPVYETIVREEKPDVVIGDVLSLDLALPIRLAREGVIPSVQVMLRVRDYTPDWSRSFIEKEVARANAIHHLHELKKLITK